MGWSSLRGKLLVATPPLVDEHFDRTVLLLLEHGHEGALGVILNRPTEDDVEGLLDTWAPYTSRPRVVFHGGPVEPGALIGLARMRGSELTSDWAPVLERVGTVDLLRAPQDIDPAVEAVRLFLGYAGWGSGQLEGELKVGAWIVAEALPDDPFAADPLQLWRAVLGRQPGRVRWLATFPDDLSAN